jgi:tetratricopeptide (TPR) repeat protein
LRGDLDNIVTKALKKSPAERYQTAQALAEDLQRYLNDEPVSARRDSLWYRAGKFVARNRPAVAAATLVLVAILSGAGVAVWQAREASRERDHARSLLARNASVINFVSTMLTEIAPEHQPVRLGELLDRSGAMLLPLETDPERRAVILELIGEYHLYHRETEKAGPLLDQALTLTRDSNDSVLRGAILCRSAFAALAGLPGDPTALAKQGLALTADDARESINCLQALSAAAQRSGDARTALDLTLRAQTLLHASGIKERGLEILLLRDAATDYYAQGDLIGAYRLNERARSELAAAGLNQSKIALEVYNNLGKTNLSAGDELRAMALFDDGLQFAVARWPGETAPERLLGNRAAVLRRLARHDEALIAFNQAVAAGERNSKSIWLNESRAGRASVYVALGDLTAAEQELTSLEPQLGTTIGRETPAAIAIREARAELDAARENFAAALSSYSENVDVLNSRAVIVAPLVQTLVARADVYLRLGNPSAALADARSAVELIHKARRPSRFSSLEGESLLMLARVQESLGQHSEARASAGEAMPHLDATLGGQHPLTLRARNDSTWLRAVE